MSNRDSRIDCTAAQLSYVAAICVAVGLLATAGVSTTVAQDTEPGLDCVGSGGGAAYVTDSGLTVFENDTDAGFGTVYFPDSETVRFEFPTDGVNLSAAGEADARLENGTGPTTCLGDINATEHNVTVAPDSENNLTLAGTYDGLSFRDVNFSTAASGTDIAYNASDPAAVTVNETGLLDGTTVRAFDSGGSELDSGSVGPDGSVTLDGLPAGEYDLNLTASEQEPISYSNLAVSDSTVVAGESFDVSATVTNNDGSSSQRYTAELKTNGTVVDTKSGLLASEANTQVAFTTSFSTAGRYDVTINDLPAKPLDVTVPGPAGIESALEADGTLEFVSNKSAQIDPDSVQIFLDGREIHNASDSSFADPLDDVRITSPTGESTRRHTIELLAGGQPLDIDPTRTLTVAFDLERSVGGLTTTVGVSETVTVSGAVVLESAGYDDTNSAQRIYRGAPIAIRSDLSGTNTDIFVDATAPVLDSPTGQNSQILTIDSTSSQFNTGETVAVEFNGDSSNVEYFEIQDLAWSAAATQTTVPNGSTLDVDVTARRSGAPFTAKLENGSGDVVATRQQTLDSGGSTLTFDPQKIVGLNTDDGPYTLTATDNRTTNTATTKEITLSDSPPANFSVEITSTTTPVTAGETLSVTTAVTNDGSITTTKTVTLADFDGGQVDSQSVTLDGGNSTTVTLDWNTGSSDAGSGDVTVASENDTDTAQVSLESTVTDNPGIESAIEAGGFIEFVTNETTTIESNSLQLFLDGTEIYNGSDGTTAGPIDGATVTPATGAPDRTHTIALTNGGSPVDIDPNRNLTVVFDLSFEDSTADTAEISGPVFLTGSVVLESAGNDDTNSAQRIYRGAPIAIRSDQNGENTDIFIDATAPVLDSSTGQHSQMLTVW